MAVSGTSQRTNTSVGMIARRDSHPRNQAWWSWVKAATAAMLLGVPVRATSSVTKSTQGVAHAARIGQCGQVVGEGTEDLEEFRVGACDNVFHEGWSGVLRG